MGQPLQFIHYAPSLKGEDLLSAHIARSHTAKVNRQNLAKSHRLGFGSGPEGSNGSRTTKLIWSRKQGSGASDIPEEGRNDTVERSDSSNQALRTCTYGQSLCLPDVPYGLSPVFGGHAANAFDVAESSPAVVEVAHYGESMHIVRCVLHVCYSTAHIEMQCSMRSSQVVSRKKKDPTGSKNSRIIR